MRVAGLPLLLCALLAAARPAPVSAQLFFVEDVLTEVRQTVVAVDEEQRLLRRALEADGASPEVVQQLAAESVDRLGDCVSAITRLSSQIDLGDEDANTVIRVNEIVGLADSYALAVLHMMNGIQVEAGRGASLDELRQLATADQSVLEERARLVAAFNALAGRYRVEPLPESIEESP